MAREPIRIGEHSAETAAEAEHQAIRELGRTRNQPATANSASDLLALPTMKKLLLAGFWSAQYLFGIAAMVAIHNKAALPFTVFLVASLYSTKIGAKLLGIEPALVQTADKLVPNAVEVAWKIACFCAVGIFISSRLAQFPLTTVHGLALVYFVAAIRDAFLVRFYFRSLDMTLSR